MMCTWGRFAGDRVVDESDMSRKTPMTTHALHRVIFVILAGDYRFATPHSEAPRLVPEAFAVVAE